MFVMDDGMGPRSIDVTTREARLMTRTTLVVLGITLLVAVVPLGAAAAGSGGISGPAFYVDGVAYRTVATPTDLSGTGAPAHSFETLYDFGGLQPLNVATAAPGDRDYNGGRWMVHALTFPDYDAALAAHDANDSGDF